MGSGHAGSRDTFVQGPESRDEPEPHGRRSAAGLTPRNPPRQPGLRPATPSQAPRCRGPSSAAQQGLLLSVPVGTDAQGSPPGSLSRGCRAVRLTVQSRGSLVPQPPIGRPPAGGRSGRAVNASIIPGPDAACRAGSLLGLAVLGSRALPNPVV